MTPAEELWGMLARPLDCHRVAESLLGLTPVVARLMSGVILASSPEVDRLIEEMPAIIRSLAIATTARNERLHGEVRGPVVWSETMVARASSAGDPAVFVCTNSVRAYDTAENRVLVGALRAIVAAARLVERQGLRRRNTELARHVRENVGLAVRYADHRALNGITRPPDRRDLARTRGGKRHRTYSPALAVLRRAAMPITAAHLAALSDPRTEAQHAALVELVRVLHDRGHGVGALRAAGGTLEAGPVTYIHDGAHLASPRPPGIHLGHLLLDVPVDRDGQRLDPTQALAGLEARAGGLACAIVADPGDLERAVDRSAALAS